MPSALLGFARDIMPSALVLILLAAVLMYVTAMKHWEGALKEPGPDRYELVRALRLGGHPRLLYIHWIAKALNRADRILGDADKAGLSLRLPFGRWPRYPYWTGWSFDVCALIGVVYPVGGLFLTWLATGDAGEIGGILRLQQGADGWQRLLAGVAVVWGIFATIKSMRADGWRSMLWLVSLAGVVAGVGVGVVAGFGAGAGVAWLAQRASSRARLGSFWLMLWPVAIVVCYLGLWLQARLQGPDTASMPLIVIGLVPLVNMPFDWASVGFTRALLRRGCERDAMAPLRLGSIDFAIGLILLLLLAATLIVALHLVDVVMAPYRQGTDLIDVPKRLLALYARPGDPGNWWIYLTLFSTLIPSVLNLLVGMVSVATWFPRRQRLAIRRKIRLLSQSGRDTTRHAILRSLGLHAGFGTAATGLLIWATLSLLALVAPYVLQMFLLFAVWLEWVLPI